MSARVCVMREKTDVFLCNLIMADENGTSEGRL